MENLSVDFNDRDIWTIYNIDYVNESDLLSHSFFEKWNAQLLCEYFCNDFASECDFGGYGVVVAIPPPDAEAMMEARAAARRQSSDCWEAMSLPFHAHGPRKVEVDFVQSRRDWAMQSPNYLQICKLAPELIGDDSDPLPGL